MFCVKFLSLLFAIAIVIAGLAFLFVQKYDVPESYLPWKEINLMGVPGTFTGLKLSELQKDLAKCQKALSRADIQYEVMPDQRRGVCNLQNQVTLQQSKYPYSARVKGRCSMVAALIIWEKSVVEPLARQYLDDEIAKINHMGIFSCRNIQGSKRRSQHASANAIDISGFITKSGQRISVLNDWDKDSAKGRFIRAVNRKSCKIFRGVLGPEYNAAHRNHFHLDMGPYRICS